VRWSCHSKTPLRAPIFPDACDFEMTLNVAGTARLTGSDAAGTQAELPPGSPTQAPSWLPISHRISLLRPPGRRYARESFQSHLCDRASKASIPAISRHPKLVQGQLGRSLLPAGHRISFPHLLTNRRTRAVEARAAGTLCEVGSRKHVPGDTVYKRHTSIMTEATRPGLQFADQSASRRNVSG
jgi:hypothetical protein